MRFAGVCFAAGATVLQVRAKRLASGALVDLVAAVVEVARKFDALVIVNDRADVARMTSAGGVHVGQDDIAPSAARTLLGPLPRIGVSTHTEAQLRAAVSDPAVDHIAIGPVFGTATKATGYEPVGLGSVRRAAELAATRDLPVVAIGGITLERAGEVIEAGASAVAVISDLVCEDPAARVRAYLQQLQDRAGYNRRA